MSNSMVVGEQKKKRCSAKSVFEVNSLTLFSVSLIGSMPPHLRYNDNRYSRFKFSSHFFSISLGKRRFIPTYTINLSRVPYFFFQTIIKMFLLPFFLTAIVSMHGPPHKSLFKCVYAPIKWDISFNIEPAEAAPHNNIIQLYSCETKTLSFLLRVTPNC